MTKFYEIECQECGKECKSRGPKFCSRSCATRHKNLTNNPSQSEDAKKKISLARIGKPTTLGWVPSQTTRDNIAASKRGKKQSDEWVSKRVLGWKKTAGTNGGMTPAHKRQLEHIQKTYSGANHPNWQGGTTKERVKEYRNPLYIAYRSMVLERDDYTCQHCGTRGGRLEVHHNHIPYTQCKGPLVFLRYYPENGLTLCRTCHNCTKTIRPDLDQSTFSQLPQHIIELIAIESWAQF